MEGTAGVCSWQQVNPENTSEYPVYRRYMTQEVAAAIEGARSVGAREILVNDSHWSMRNLLFDDLPADVRVISGSRKPRSMVEGAQLRFDAAFFTGYHAKIGDANGVLAHTYSDETLYNVIVNGEPCSEALLNAAFLGMHATPVVLITGDRTIVGETTRRLPWVTGVVVKDAIGGSAVNTMTPSAAREAIRDGAREALTQIARAKPFVFDPPIDLVIETARVENADFIELLPGFARIGGRAVRFLAPDYARAFSAFIVAMRLGGAANAVA